ncbi:MAG: hypothetical protein R3C15_19385 [Thermoleophilia bacterium]
MAVDETTGRALPMVSPGEEPRAAYGIRRAKAMGGLIGFLLAVVLSLTNDASLTDALWRGVIGGIAGNLVCWVAAVAWWRAYLRAEARVAIERVLAERRRQREAASGGES